MSNRRWCESPLPQTFGHPIVGIRGAVIASRLGLRKLQLHIALHAMKSIDASSWQECVTGEPICTKEPLFA